MRIKVQACGICHSDTVTKDGLFPGIQYPRVPGHEVIGVIDAVGPNVPRWKTGQRVGVGWNGGYCGYCDNCRRGDFFACLTSSEATGVTRDGGYAEYMLAPISALALVPDDLSSVEAAPLMCAGVTTFNCLRNSGAGPGDVVAVLGIGGLGHLAVQYAAKMGCKTVAIARGKDEEPLARQLGAHYHIDNKTQDPAVELQKLGGAKVILATVTSAEAMKQVSGRARRARQAHDHRRRSLARSEPAANDLRQSIGRRLVLRHVHRFGRHAQLQRALGRPVDE